MLHESCTIYGCMCACIYTFPWKIGICVIFLLLSLLLLSGVLPLFVPHWLATGHILSTNYPLLSRLACELYLFVLQFCTHVPIVERLGRLNGRSAGYPHLTVRHLVVNNWSCSFFAVTIVFIAPSQRHKLFWQQPLEIFICLACCHDVASESVP